MAHKIVHWEIMGPDGDALTSFYADLFGWETEAVPGFDQYYQTTADDSGVSGAVGKGGEETPSYVTLYVEVDSVDEHLSKAEANGGKTIMPRMVIPDVVTFGLMADPAGNMIGIVERDDESA